MREQTNHGYYVMRRLVLWQCHQFITSLGQCKPQKQKINNTWQWIKIQNGRVHLNHASTLGRKKQSF